MSTVRWGLVLAGSALLAALFLDLPGSHLVDPDESRYAEIAREMVATGDWVSPRLNGTSYWEKPPLLYWTTAASIGVLGPGDGAARLPVRLAAAATAVLLLVFGGVRGAGPSAALAFLASPVAFLLGRYLLTDMVLCACTTASLLLLHRILSEHEGGRRSAMLAAAFGAATALAVLAKGLVGLAIPGLVLLAWCAILGRWRAFLDVVFSPAPPAFVAVAAPWFLLMERANPGFSWYFLVGEHFGRFAAGRVRHAEPSWYIVAVFLAGFLPWTAYLLGALRPLLVRSREALRGRSDDLYFALWVAVVVLFFSVSRSRLATYVLPAIPGAAMLVGRFLAREEAPPFAPLRAIAILWSVVAAAGVLVATAGRIDAFEGLLGPAAAAGGIVTAGSWLAVLAARRDPRAGPLVLAGAMAGMFLAADFAFPAVARVRSLREISLLVAREPRAEVFMYDCFAANLPWTLGRTVPVVAYTGEMASDGKRPPEVLPSEEEFWRKWDSGERVLAVLRPRDRGAFRRPGRPVPRVLAGDLEAPRGFVLVANYGP
jgi:4-amino-4-deoxy-L-arabinose transferase-like glycosyltransferase